MIHNRAPGWVGVAVDGPPVQVDLPVVGPTQQYEVVDVGGPTVGPCLHGWVGTLRGVVGTGCTPVTHLLTRCVGRWSPTGSERPTANGCTGCHERFGQPTPPMRPPVRSRSVAVMVGHDHPGHRPGTQRERAAASPNVNPRRSPQPPPPPHHPAPPAGPVSASVGAGRGGVVSRSVVVCCWGWSVATRSASEALMVTVTATGNPPAVAARCRGRRTVDHRDQRIGSALAFRRAVPRPPATTPPPHPTPPSPPPRPHRADPQRSSSSPWKVTTTRRRSYPPAHGWRGSSPDQVHHLRHDQLHPRTVNRGSSSMIADTTRCSTSPLQPVQPRANAAMTSVHTNPRVHNDATWGGGHQTGPQSPPLRQNDPTTPPAVPTGCAGVRRNTRVARPPPTDRSGASTAVRTRARTVTRSANEAAVVGSATTASPAIPASSDTTPVTDSDSYPPRQQRLGHHLRHRHIPGPSLGPGSSVRFLRHILLEHMFDTFTRGQAANSISTTFSRKRSSPKRGP